jgi:hypothetical protein
VAVEDVKVSLGKDPRISGASLSVAVFAGLSRAGCLVFEYIVACICLQCFHNGRVKHLYKNVFSFNFLITRV